MSTLNFLTEWRSKTRQRRGAALAAALLWMGMLGTMGTGIVSFTSSTNVRVANEENRAIALNAADAGLQEFYNSVWRNFRINQRFDDMDSAFTNASELTPKANIDPKTLDYDSKGRFSVAVVEYTNVTQWKRQMRVRSIGWVDRNQNGVFDSNEVRRIVETQVEFALERSKVFDYAYFVNNYGWMNGFSSSELIVNGDMRANGNFDFSGGTPTINGSVYAARNDKLIPPAAGIVNITPTQWTNSYYNAHAPQTARQAYAEARMGSKGSDEYENWRELIYDGQASMVRGAPSGAVVGDANGIRSYQGTVLDPNPTEEVIMPDLSDIDYYKELSRDYVNSKAKFQDGSNNPYFGLEPYIEVWNSSLNKYERITSDGIVSGSAKLIGTTSKPVKIHGPCTVDGDIVIKGVIEGQGTLYAARNVHIVGNITYKQAPNFSGNSMNLIDKANEKKDMLGLAARGSIMMGNTKTFTNTTLQYMTPPFTKARYDDNGNIIPAFNAKQKDYTGMMRYQSVFGDTYINSVSENINQINAVLYTNFLGGGNIGQGGSGCVFNGSIISRDEAMVLQSLPLQMNYDNRLKWRYNMDDPLIDINLPLAPTFNSLTWNEIPA